MKTKLILGFLIIIFMTLAQNVALARNGSSNDSNDSKTKTESAVSTGVETESSSSSSAASSTPAALNPKQALDRLMQGNQRFVKEGNLCSNRNQDRRNVTAQKQEPFAVILGCSDSRVPPELAFDQGIGDIFVVRVAGNVVGANELDSIEYSAIHNHSSIVLVLGHQNCGAVDAVLNNNTQDIESIADFIRPVIGKGKSLDDAIKDNIRHSVDVVKKSAPIAKLIKDGKIDVVGGYYDLTSGAVTLLDRNN